MNTCSRKRDANTATGRDEELISVLTAISVVVKAACGEALEAVAAGTGKSGRRQTLWAEWANLQIGVRI